MEMGCGDVQERKKPKEEAERGNEEDERETR